MKNCHLLDICCGWLSRFKHFFVGIVYKTLLCYMIKKMASHYIDSLNWRGSSLEEVYRHLNKYYLEHIPPVRPSEIHSVLYHHPINAPENQPPKPMKGHHKWDTNHVRLPCSSKSQYPVIAKNGEVTFESRWGMIEKALLRPIKNTIELEAVILSYNLKYRDVWKFHSLHQLFEEEINESESQIFFDEVLPNVIRLALRLPEIVQTAIPLLKQGQTRSISLSQQQIACLLANAFLCTFPRRNSFKRKSEYSSFPSINFNRLFQAKGNCVLEKIKCICHYFRQVSKTSNSPTGVLTFTRRFVQLSDMPKWSKENASLGMTPFHITSQGTIEEHGIGLLQVDFANKFLGGGVLGSGCVQEEIRFVICPELLISKLFTEALRPNEAVIIAGSERYSTYKGYAHSFVWTGNYDDKTPFDVSRRRQTHLVAIDALSFAKSTHQYREELMLRELNKAYVGFFHPLETLAPGVASGNWGCGAFGGDAFLKALLQLMACTVTKRPLVYFTFGNSELRDAVYEMHAFLIKHNVRVKDLWACLRIFEDQHMLPKELYNFLYKCLGQNKIHVITSVKNKKASASTSLHEDSKKKLSRTPRLCPLKDAFSDVNEKYKTKSVSFSSTESEDDAMLEIKTTRDSNQSSNTKSSMLIFKHSSHSTIGSTNATSSAHAKDKKRSEQRQRTLLEMLDQCYTGSSPAKRHCNANDEKVDSS